MTKPRTALGVAAIATGISLMAFALHLGGHANPVIAGKAGTALAGLSAVGGGALTFQVGRRLTAGKTETSSVDDQRPTNG